MYYRNDPSEYSLEQATQAAELYTIEGVHYIVVACFDQMIANYPSPTQSVWEGYCSHRVSLFVCLLVNTFFRLLY